MGSCFKGFKEINIDWILIILMILSQLTYQLMLLMNASFWLLSRLRDIDLILMNSSVVFYGVLNDVAIVLNWCLFVLILINLYKIHWDSLSIVIIVLNWCSSPWVTTLWYWIGWFIYGLKWWEWIGGTLTRFYLFYVN